MAAFSCSRRPLAALLAALALSACGALPRHKAKPASPDGRRAALAQRQVEVLAELDAAARAGGGWPAGRDCDGTLWAGLAAAAGAGAVELARVEYAPGRIDRRPAPSCLEDEDGNGRPDSGSSVSRDMLTGYLWGVWRRGDAGAAERLAAYGEAHDWVMGDGDPLRTGMRPALTGLLGRIVAALGGPEKPYRGFGAFYTAAGKDYERHIAALGILLGGEVAGSIPVDHLEVLRALAVDAPGDALMQAARGVYEGDMGAALALLLDPAYAAPGYVRGPAIAAAAHWAFAASLALRQLPKEG